MVVNVGLLGVLLWDYTHKWGFSAPAATADGTPQMAADPYGLDSWGIHLEVVVMGAFAVLVWARALALLNPMSSKLGALLYTLRRAAEEAAVVVPVLVVLVVGFATTITVVYSPLIPEFGSLTGTMRSLLGVTGGDLRLLVFEDAGRNAASDNAFLAVWGQVILLAYIVIVNILIMTLLIAGRLAGQCSVLVLSPDACWVLLDTQGGGNKCCVSLLYQPVCCVLLLRSHQPHLFT